MVNFGKNSDIKKQHNNAYFVSCYVLSSPKLLELDSIVDISIEQYGMEMFYILKYKTIKDINLIRRLSSKEPNLYNKRLQNGTYNVKFYIRRKYHNTVKLIMRCGYNGMTKKTLMDMFYFTTKNLDNHFGSRGFILSIFFR